MKYSIFCLILAIGLIQSCSVMETSEATHILNGKAYPATDAQNIEVFLQKPDKEYIIIGLVESRGMGVTTEKKDLELSMRALKNEAAKIGADALIINTSQQKLVQSDGSTERRISATAIRFN